MAVSNALRFAGLLMVVGLLIGGVADSMILRLIGFGLAGLCALAAIFLARRQPEESE